MAISMYPATSSIFSAGLAAHDTYWGITVPGNAISGNYTGTITFTAAYAQ